MNSPPPLWVAVEGPAGAGKTYLSRLLARRYGARCVMVDEICNYGPDTLEGQVVAALAATGDPFLRTGPSRGGDPGAAGAEGPRMECRAPGAGNAAGA